jgi:endonuclease-3
MMNGATLGLTPVGPTMAVVLARLRQHYGEPVERPRQPAIDELIATILSQSTSDRNTERAYAGLRERFPTWDDVAVANPGAIADAIRVGGLAERKAPLIQEALRSIVEHVGDYDLSFLAELPINEARDWLTSLRGVGPKTASCVLLFSLGRPALPVDTHVHRVSRRLGLIPSGASAEAAHQLLEARVQETDVYAAHMLLLRHGRQTCKALRPQCSGCVLVQCCPAAARYLASEQD